MTKREAPSCAVESIISPKGLTWYFPQVYRNGLHGKLLLLALSIDRAGTLGFRRVSDTFQIDDGTVVV
jgi:hypothetical protein